MTVRILVAGSADADPETVGRTLRWALATYATDTDPATLVHTGDGAGMIAQTEWRKLGEDRPGHLSVMVPKHAPNAILIAVKPTVALAFPHTGDKPTGQFIRDMRRAGVHVVITERLAA